MTGSLKALITGIGGQDGSYMADLLVSKGYEVHGLVRRHSERKFVNIDHLVAKGAVRLWEGDLADAMSLDHILCSVKPDEVYNFAAQSHVGTSFTQPMYTFDVTGVGVHRLLSAIQRHVPRARVYQASSSEQYGNLGETVDLLSIRHPFEPVSPYGMAKLVAHYTARMFRTAHDMHVSCGILHNHESERRGLNFVTRKITRHLAEVKMGVRDQVLLGNLDAVRDWGYAPEYMEGCRRMLMQDEPGDYVLATGFGTSVRSFLVKAYNALGINRPLDQVVSVVAAEKRPTDIARLVGDPSDTEDRLGWKAKTNVDGLVARMVQHDLAMVQKEGGARVAVPS